VRVAPSSFRNRFLALSQIRRQVKFSTQHTSVSNTDTKQSAEHTAIMPHTLLTLPPELRNQIYSYALPTETQEVRFSFSVFPRVPAITQVSKQIRAEASGM